MMRLSLAIVFWMLVGFSVLTACLILIPSLKKYRPFRFLATLMAILSLLGGALIFLTLKQDVGGMLKVFLILTGVAPAGMVVSMALHNAFYALAKGLFGKEVEEAFFFLIALFGCPAALVVGITGTIVMIVRNMIHV